MRSIELDLNARLLWLYREFNRIAKPAPYIPFVSTSNVIDLSKDVQKHGIQKPVELSIFNNTALLTDGNHRVGVCVINKIEIVKTKITVYESFDELSSVFYEQSIKRFRKANLEIKKIMERI